MKRHLQASVGHFVKHNIRWMLIDFLVVVLAYFVAYSARILAIPTTFDDMRFVLFPALITILMLYLNNVYKRIWSQTSGHGITIILQSVMMASALTLIPLLLFSPRPMPLSVFLPASFLTFGGLVVVRYRSRLVGAMEWRWRAIWRHEFPKSGQKDRILIVGAGESGQNTALRIKHRIDDSQYHIVGFVDDDMDKQGMYVENIPILGVTAEIPLIVEDYAIDMIVVSIHNIDGPSFRRILGSCEQTQARVKVVPDMYAHLKNPNVTQTLRDVRPEDLIGRSIVTRHPDVEMSLVMRRVVLVTGAAGSIGSEISRQMLGYELKKLVLLDNNESALHDLYMELTAKSPELHIEPVLADVTDIHQVQSVYERYSPQIVYHAAAYKHVPLLEHFPGEAIRVNVGGTFNLAQMAKVHKVERFVLISTDKAVNPSNVMGASKRLCEIIVQAMCHQNGGTLFTAVRFGNVLGSRGSVVPTFNRQIDDGGPVTVTDKRMSRYFMSIPEASNLVIHAAAMTKGCEIFILQMGDEIKIIDIAERMIRLRGLRPYVDIPIEFTGVRPGEKIREELYHESQTISDSMHPHIMRLVESYDAQVNQKRLAEIERLVRDGVEDSSKTLEYLLSICDLTSTEETQIH